MIGLLRKDLYIILKEMYEKNVVFPVANTFIFCWHNGTTKPSKHIALSVFLGMRLGAFLLHHIGKKVKLSLYQAMEAHRFVRR
jgi:hypothetical protein